MSAKRPSRDRIETPFQRQRPADSTLEIRPASPEPSERPAGPVRSTESTPEAPPRRQEHGAGGQRRVQPQRVAPQPHNMSSLAFGSMSMIPNIPSFDVRSVASASVTSQRSDIDDATLARGSQRSVGRRSGTSTARGSATMSRISQADSVAMHEMAESTKTVSTELRGLQRLLQASSLHERSPEETRELQKSIERLQKEEAKLSQVTERLSRSSGLSNRSEDELRGLSNAGRMGLRQIAAAAKEELRKNDRESGAQASQAGRGPGSSSERSSSGGSSSTGGSGGLSRR